MPFTGDCPGGALAAASPLLSSRGEAAPKLPPKKGPANKAPVKKAPVKARKKTNKIKETPFEAEKRKEVARLACAEVGAIERGRLKAAASGVPAKPRLHRVNGAAYGSKFSGHLLPLKLKQPRRTRSSEPAHAPSPPSPAPASPKKPPCPKEPALVSPGDNQTVLNLFFATHEKHSQERARERSQACRAGREQQVASSSSMSRQKERPLDVTYQMHLKDPETLERCNKGLAKNRARRAAKDNKANRLKQAPFSFEAASDASPKMKRAPVPKMKRAPVRSASLRPKREMLPAKRLLDELSSSRSSPLQKKRKVATNRKKESIVVRTLEKDKQKLEKEKQKLRERQEAIRHLNRLKRRRAMKKWLIDSCGSY